MSDTLKTFMTLFKEVDHEVANDVISWIIDSNMLSEANRPDYLELIINSPGGSLYHGLSIINAMRTSVIPIRTTCIGSASSMAAHIFIQGARGFRYMHRGTSLLFHSSRCGYEAVPREQIEIDMAHSKLIDDHLDMQITECSKLNIDDVKKDLIGPLDRYVYADEAIALGLCDFKYL